MQGLRNHTFLLLLSIGLYISGAFGAAGPAKFRANEARKYYPLALAMIAEAAHRSTVGEAQKVFGEHYSKSVVQAVEKFEDAAFPGSVNLVLFNSGWSGSKHIFHVGISSNISAHCLEKGAKVPSKIKAFVDDTMRKKWQREYPGLFFASVVGYKMGGTIASQTIADNQKYYPGTGVVTFNSGAVVSRHRDTIREGSCDRIIKGSLQCHLMTMDCPKDWARTHFLISQMFTDYGIPQREGSGDYYASYLRSGHRAFGSDLTMQKVLKCLVEYGGSKSWKDLMANHDSKSHLFNL